MYSEKVGLDKFYTKSEVVQECLKYIDLDAYDCVIEPSAGDGAFYNNIDHSNKIGLDISPENNNIIKQDWFEYGVDSNYNKVLVIGNPPFGKRNKLSKSFIEHACSFDNVYTVAFVLPDVFNKHTLQKSVPDSFRLKTIVKLQDDGFTIDGESYHVPCSFFVFEKSQGECLRFNPDLYKETDDWYFGTKNDYDFFVMGASINTVKNTPSSTNRGYYIKAKLPIETVKKRFQELKQVGNSSVNGGVSWVTKPELVKTYQENNLK